MKARAIEAKKEFTPVTIEITFETEQEMRDFKAFFNYIPVCDILERLNLNSYIIKDAVPCVGFLGSDWTDFVSRAKGG